MSTEYSKYAVVVEKFAERYYIKRFKKKYSKKVWRVTQSAIEAVCANPERAVEVGKMETVNDSGDVLICKMNFAVAGEKRSPRSSGNRAIVALHKKEKISYILLVYHKKDLGGGRETESWKKKIKENYPCYKDIL